MRKRNGMLLMESVEVPHWMPEASDIEKVIRWMEKRLRNPLAPVPVRIVYGNKLKHI